MNTRLFFLLSSSLCVFSASSPARAADQLVPDDIEPEISSLQALTTATVLSERDAFRQLHVQEQHEIASVAKGKTSRADKKTKIKMLRNKYSEMRKNALIRSRLQLRKKLYENPAGEHKSGVAE